MAPTGEHGVACGHPGRPMDAHGDAWGKHGTHRHLQGHVDAHSTHGRHTWDIRTLMEGRGTPTGDTWHPSSHPDQGHPGEPVQGNRNSSHPSHTPMAAPTRGTCRPQHSSIAPTAALPHSSDLCHPQQPPTAPMTTAPMTHSWHCSIAPMTHDTHPHHHCPTAVVSLPALPDLEGPIAPWRPQGAGSWRLWGGPRSWSELCAPVLPPVLPQFPLTPVASFLQCLVTPITPVTTSKCQ